MACNNGPSCVPEYERAPFLDAALCALWEVLRRQSLTYDEIIELVNFTEAGVHPDALWQWRQHHDRKDELRRREEAESAERAAEAAKLELIDSRDDDEREKNRKMVVFLAAALECVWDSYQDENDFNDKEIIYRLKFKEFGITQEELEAWREQYYAETEARIQREKIRNNALEKLTPEERVALGYPAPAAPGKKKGK